MLQSAVRFLLIICLSGPLLAQSAPKNGARRAPSGGYYTKWEAEAQVERFTKLKKKGARRSIIGGSMTFLSIIFLASSDWHDTPTGVETNSPQGVIGGFMLFPAIPITITGLVQLGIGSSKVQEYQNLFNDTQVSMSVGKDKVGLMVTHSF